MNELEAHDSFAAKMAEKFPRYFGEGKRYGGFAIGEGWYPIIESLVSQIHSYTKHMRSMRARDLLRVRAKRKGLGALIVFHKGKSKVLSDWGIERAQKDFDEEIKVTPRLNYINIVQIKEKFGGLRFYYDGGDAEISGMVSMAETWASHSCETCGDRGEQRSGGWIRTLCDRHEAEYQERKKANV